MSDADRWERVKDLFAAALSRPAAERAPYLEDACPDAGMRREVESLLASHESAGSFLEAPAAPPSQRLAANSRLGPYEILGPIGSGGMGDVYRARDPRLVRDVAIKVLPRVLAEDPERRRRFEREARAASALSHPNIVAVYDAGLQDGTPFIVTELLVGQSLAERAAAGPLPVRRVLECGAQVARGLAAAHQRGIVHRDVKPANLFLTSQGQVKILDFGIAKADGTLLLSDPGRERPPSTVPGVVLGTVGYMSPEQVRGLRVDARSDQFSLGCVLYELLAGQAPFSRPSAAQTLAAVLEAEPPPLPEGPRRIPRHVAWIVERCLAKDPQDRYQSTDDLARDLELAIGRLTETGATPAPATRGVRWRSLALPAAACVAGAAAGAFWTSRAPEGVPSLRYLTYSGRDSSPAASPDGKTIAFSSTRDGRRRLWLKQLATGSEVPLTSGEDDHPRFSPDGSLVLFARSEQGRVSLFRVASVGGEPLRLVDDALYGDYSPDGRRLAFLRQATSASGFASALVVANADGSDARGLARLESGAFVHPRWSPDGRSIAVTEAKLQLGEPTVIALVDAQSGAVRELRQPGAGGVWPGGVAWSGSGRLLCSQTDSPVGQQTAASSRIVSLDASSQRMRPLLSSAIDTLTFDVLGPGRLVFEARSLRQSLRRIPLRAGAAAAAQWLTRGNSADRQPTYTRDGEWIAFSSNRSGNQDLWAVSTRTGALRRLTDHPGQDFDPAFLPDGRLAFSSNRGGHFEVWTAAGDGSGARQLSRDGVDAENPVATPDGRFVVYASTNPKARGILKLALAGGEPARLAAGNMILPEVSPDGRFVAFVADQGGDRAALRVVSLEDGRPAPFEIPLPAWIAGGTIDQGRCRWRPDGKAIAYVGREASGAYVVYEQDFRPGLHTSAGRRVLATLGPDLEAESLAFSPDGGELTVSFREQLFDLMLAEGVPDVER